MIRIPCSTAMLKAISLAPGRNAETFEALLSAAKAMAVLKAVASASGRETARGPMWPLLLTVVPGVKGHASRRGLIDQIPVMLLARYAQDAGVNFGKALQVRGSLFEPGMSELRARWPAQQTITCDVEKVNRKPRE